jgi:hypothetical protein
MLVTFNPKKQVPNDKVQSMTHEEVTFTPKELLEYSNLCKLNHAWEWILCEMLMEGPYS